MKVLVVDDNQDLANGLADVLEMEGHSVEVKSTAESARKYFSSNKVDYVFLDMKLPDGNGLDLFYEFHNLSPECRILIMTGFRIDQVLQQLVDDGAVGILRKPFDMNQVLSLLQNVEPEGIVLIVDDDPEFAGSVAEFLIEYGRKPAIARTGEEAIEFALNNDIDVMILDLRLPVLCGAEVYLRLKKEGKTVPTIIVTGFAAEEEDVIDDLRSMSVTNCLFKPFDPEEILKAMKHLRAA